MTHDQTSAGAVIALAKELEQDRSAAYLLWTTLPSFARAKRAHGADVERLTPRINVILREASLFISHGGRPSAQQQEAAGVAYRCPCCDDQDDGQDGASAPDRHGAWPMTYATPEEQPNNNRLKVESQ